MRLAIGTAVSIAALVLAGCGGSSTQSANKAPASSPSAATSPTAPVTDEPGFLAAAAPHVAGTQLDSVSDAELLGIGDDFCKAFRRGVTADQLLRAKLLPRRSTIQLIRDATTHLCTDYAGIKLPPVPKKPPRFPAGYPKIVPVSSLPDQPRSLYEGTYKQAVAIAPGVWAALTPGASLQDVANGDILEGYCASIKAYERKYTPGKTHGGSCY